MSHLDPQQPDAELDAVLRRSVPAPTPTGSPGSSGASYRLRRASAGWRAAGPPRCGSRRGLRGALVVLALAGVGPLGGDSSDVRAKDDCKLVRVERVERVPVVVESPSGDRSSTGASVCSAGNAAAASADRPIEPATLSQEARKLRCGSESATSATLPASDWRRTPARLNRDRPRARPYGLPSASLPFRHG